MKKNYLLAFTLAAAGIIIYACKEDFLERTPPGVLNEAALASKKGVEGLLVGAYAMLDGFSTGAGPFTGGWASSASNWVYGSIVGGDAHKGTDAGDQPDINPIERYEATPTNGYFDTKWVAVYEGVARANNVLKIMAKATDISDADRTRIAAEARFLRAHYHFEAKKMWNNVPWVDETVTNYKLSNQTDIWPKIEEDLKFAYDNLPELQPQIGRVNKWAAAAMYGKALLYQNKFNEARTVLNEVYTKGKNPLGVPYKLMDRFQDNFNAETQNSTESVFAVQYSVNDGAPDAANGGWGEVLNFPYNGGPGGCCGFFQPSQDLVNSYQVDANGLPLLDSYNASEVKSDQGVKADEPFTPDTRPLDPRLDWTVGRRGIPFLDWGPHPGVAWVRDQSYGGPYSPKKNTFYQSQKGLLTDKSFWTSGVTANNYTLIRFADVILMLAETEVEVGSLDRAAKLVNEVRKRAQNPAGFVRFDNGDPAANYQVGLYPEPFPNQEYARKAVRFERKLELAMEGHRFFDLVRWGIAAPTLNAYIQYEGTQARNRRPYLAGAVFDAGKEEYFPIPQAQIDLSSEGGTPTLKQNPGY